MLSGVTADYYKTLCPVCEDNIILKDFKPHMETNHKEFCEKAQVNDETYSILYQSTSLKNITNHVYYNWDYHIQTKYKLSTEDKRNYEIVKTSLEKLNIELTHKNILNNLVKLNPKYEPYRLAVNILRILIDEFS